MDPTSPSYSCIYSSPTSQLSARLQLYHSYFSLTLLTNEVITIPIQHALQFSHSSLSTFPNSYLLSVPINEQKPFEVYLHQKDIRSIHSILTIHQIPFHLRPSKTLLRIRAEAFWVRDLVNMELYGDINEQTEIDYLCSCTFNGRTGSFLLGVNNLEVIWVVWERQIVNVVPRKANHDVRECVVLVGSGDLAVFQFSSDARAFHYQFYQEPMDVQPKPVPDKFCQQHHNSLPIQPIIHSSPKILHDHAMKLQQEQQLLIQPVFSRNFSSQIKVLPIDQVSVIQEEYYPSEEENVQRRLSFNQPPTIQFNQQPISLFKQPQNVNEQPISLFKQPQLFGSGSKSDSIFRFKNEDTPHIRQTVGSASHRINSAEQSKKKVSQGEPTSVKRVNFGSPSRIEISISPAPYSRNQEDSKLENSKLENSKLENSKLENSKLEDSKLEKNQQMDYRPEKQTKLKFSRFESISKRGSTTEALISPVKQPYGGRDYLTRRSSRKDEDLGSEPISVLQINHKTVASLAGYLHLRVDEVTRIGSQITLNSLIPLGVMPRRLLENGKESDNVSLICADSLLEFSMEQASWGHSYPIGNALEGKLFNENTYALMGSDWLGLFDRRTRRMSLQKNFHEPHFQKIDTHGYCLIVGQQQSLLKIYDTRKLGRSHNNFELGTTDQSFKSVEVTPKGNIFCYNRDAFLIDSMEEEIYNRTIHYSDRAPLHRFTQDGAKMFSISNCEKELASLSEGQVTLVNQEGRRVIDVQGCFYVRHQRYATNHRVILGYTEKNSYSFKLHT